MRSIPAITKHLLIINIVVYLTSWLLEANGIVSLNREFGLFYIEHPLFHFYQLFTYMFLHGGIEHLFLNMFMLWMFGSVVENSWGSRRFLIYYMVCGVGAGLVQELSQGLALHFAGMYPASTVGASGALYGILMAFGLTWPDQRIFIFPIPIPIKAKWLICGSIALELFSAMSTTNDGVAHVAHLGGMLFGYILFRHWKRGGQFGMRFTMPDIFKKKKETYARDERNKDWDYNARELEREKIIDNILDKVRRNGYESLTDEEKRMLFEK